MDANVKRVLNGQHLDELTSELCDFTLEEQNRAAEAVCGGLGSLAPSQYVPILSKTVTYVVACILVNERNEVLMMQEAKKSCAGKWYLPAGRVEPNETFVEAAKREVLEETGLQICVTTLISVETAGGSWFRFVVTGNIIGGELKTPAKADSESLQAKWVADLDSLSLRATDIFPIVEVARNHRRRNPVDPAWHKDLLPASRSHHKSYLRLTIVARKRATNRVCVLLSEKNVFHFPTVELHPGRSVFATLRKFMIELFGSELPQHRPHGILSLEHQPSQSEGNTNDGICITLLIVFKATLEEVALIGKCEWQELSKELSDRITLLVSSKNSTVPLHVVR